MDAKQRRDFDELGYLVLRGAVPPTVLGNLNAKLSERLSQKTSQELLVGRPNGRGMYMGESERQPTRDRHGREYLGKRIWSEPYRWLIDNPAVVGILGELLSDPAHGHTPRSVPPEKRVQWRRE